MTLGESAAVEQRVLWVNSAYSRIQRPLYPKLKAYSYNLSLHTLQHEAHLGLPMEDLIARCQLGNHSTT
jgi:hypothetical protein